MEEKPIALDPTHIDESESANSNNNHGWQKVTYAKKHRKLPAKQTAKLPPNGSAVSGGDSVFTSLEKQSEERRRRIEAQRAALDETTAPLHRRSDDDDVSEEDFAVQNGGGHVEEEKKQKKVKKQKKPKVTIAEAAGKIDADDLAVFLADVSVSLFVFVSKFVLFDIVNEFRYKGWIFLQASYESQQDIQLMRFADYFGRAFSAVNASQFPWTKLFRESPIAKIADVS